MPYPKGINNSVYLQRNKERYVADITNPEWTGSPLLIIGKNEQCAPLPSLFFTPSQVFNHQSCSKAEVLEERNESAVY